MTEINSATPEELRTTELGILPQGWAISKLGNLFNIQQGKALSPKARLGKSPKPFLRTSNVLWGRVDLSVLDKMDFSEDEVIRLALLPGDLLVCEGGDVGRTAIWSGQLDNCCYQNHIHRLRSKGQDIEPNFYMYWMQTALLLLNLYGGERNITTIPNLSKSRLSNFSVPYPPYEEQKAIAHVLQTIQEAKEKTEEVIRATKELKNSMMKHLFTYGPVPPGEAENVKLKETEIGMIPEEWESIGLGDVVTKQKGIQRGPWGGSIKKDIFVPHGYKVYEQSNVIKNNFAIGHYFIDEKKFGELIDFEVRPGDILITAAGTLGKLAIVPEGVDKGIINQALIRLRLDISKISKIFFKYLLELIVDKGIIIGYSHGATLKNLSSISVLKAIKIPLPSLPIQQQIVLILSAIDSKIEAEEGKKKALEELFKTLLHDLMTAKIKVRNLEV